MCTYCGQCPATTLDHIIPLHHPKGVHSEANLTPACAGCNSSKGDYLLDDWPGRLCPGCGEPTGGALDAAG
jgi:5-methylcytosine-specific restriction endonuclease McrA